MQECGFLAYNRHTNTNPVSMSALAITREECNVPASRYSANIDSQLIAEWATAYSERDSPMCFVGVVAKGRKNTPMNPTQLRPRYVRLGRFKIYTLKNSLAVSALTTRLEIPPNQSPGAIGVYCD